MGEVVLAGRARGGMTIEYDGRVCRRNSRMTLVAFGVDSEELSNMFEYARG